VGLNVDILPQYHVSSFRYFEENEKHVSRICSEDVIVLVFDGLLRFVENGVPIEVKKNQYYIQRAGLEQRGIEPSDIPKYFYIHFIGDYSISPSMIPISGNYDSEFFMPLFCHLQSLENDITSSMLEKTFVFYHILSILYQINVNNGRKNMLAAEIFSEMEQNYNRHITIGMLAEKYHYSKNYITRVFHDSYKITPYQYLLLLRLQKAYQLLINSTKSVQQICDECGFLEYSVFYKQFVSRFHLSPSSARKANQI
jgi:AraC-type DNA-binding domain-containing proteins